MLDIDTNTKEARNSKHRNTLKYITLLEDIWGDRAIWDPRLDWEMIDRYRESVEVFDFNDKVKGKSYLSLEALAVESGLQEYQLKIWKEREKRYKDYNCLEQMTVIQLMGICEALNVSPEDIIRI